jgi:di/tricarboxylate transporter
MPHSNTKIGLGDVLVIRSDVEGLRKLKESGLDFLRDSEEKLKDLDVVEAIVMPNSILADKTARQTRLRDRYTVSLLGVARHGSTLIKRVDDVKIKTGDVLLLEVAQSDLQNVLRELQCAPLKKRGISLHERAPSILTLVIAGVSIALSAFSILPIEISLTLGALAMLLSRSISLKEAYSAIHWPILILIGSIIPFGIAMVNTGADKFIADTIMQTGISEPIMALIIIFAATTLLSNVMNNVAASVFMAPVALQLSQILDISGFPMLMAVVFGAAVPYLTPISHHSNLLVMEAGGYKFTDYLRFGIPLTLATMVIVIFLVPILWPF